MYRAADKSLTRPARKQARKHVRDARDFNNIETRAVIKLRPHLPQGKAPKEIHISLTETLACFLPGRAKDLSAPLKFQASAVISIRSTLLLDITKRRVAIPYRSFGYESRNVDKELQDYLDFLTLDDGTRQDVPKRR